MLKAAFLLANRLSYTELEENGKAFTDSFSNFTFRVKAIEKFLSATMNWANHQMQHDWQT